MARQKKTTTCRVTGCDRTATHKKAILCNRCYHFSRYWGDKTPTQRMQRVDELDFWSKRSDQILVPKKVVTLAKRRRAAHK